jgi:hypothetical protein
MEIIEHNKTKIKKSISAQKRIGYGVKIPLLSFESAIIIIKQLVGMGGIDGSQDALSRILNNSPSSSSYFLKVRALKSFGLINTEGNNYHLTDLATKIVQPQSPIEHDEAIFESFTRQETLIKIWENYKGKILPKEEYLANWIASNLSIPKSLSESWAKYFIASAAYLKLLHQRTDGSYQVFAQPISQKSDAPPDETIGASEPKNKAIIPSLPEPPKRHGINEFVENEEWGILYQKKISNNRKVILAVPSDLSSQDIEGIKTILKGIEASLEGLKRNEDE